MWAWVPSCETNDTSSWLYSPARSLRARSPPGRHHPLDRHRQVRPRPVGQRGIARSVGDSPAITQRLARQNHLRQGTGPSGSVRRGEIEPALRHDLQRISHAKQQRPGSGVGRLHGAAQHDLVDRVQAERRGQIAADDGQRRKLFDAALQRFVGACVEPRVADRQRARLAKLRNSSISRRRTGEARRNTAPGCQQIGRPTPHSSTHAACARGRARAQRRSAAIYWLLVTITGWRRRAPLPARRCICSGGST